MCATPIGIWSTPSRRWKRRRTRSISRPKLVQDNQSRVEIGTLAPIDVVSAQAEAASRRKTLVQSQATVRTSELALKRLIVSGTDDPLWISSINPVDRPSTTPEPINLEAAVARALADRTDLQQSKNNLKISDINLRNQVDATRPQLNLTGDLRAAGLGGPIFTTNRITDPITGIRSTSTLLQSGYWDALRNISGFDAPTWTLRLHVRVSARRQRAGGQRRAFASCRCSRPKPTSRRWSCRLRPTCRMPG